MNRVIQPIRAGPGEASAGDGGLLPADGHPADSDARPCLQPGYLKGRLFLALIPPGRRRTWHRDQAMPAHVVDGRGRRTRTHGHEQPPHMRGPVPLGQVAAAIVFSQSERQPPAWGDHRRRDVVRDNGPARCDPGGLAQGDRMPLHHQLRYTAEDLRPGTPGRSPEQDADPERTHLPFPAFPARDLQLLGDATAR